MKMAAMLRQSRWLLITVVIVALDLWTKSLAVASLDYAQPVTLLPILDFTLLYNYGAAFSFLSTAGGWQRWLFTLIALSVSVVLVIWILRLDRKEQWLAVSLALILGGAVGNLYDRMTLGYVVDFIHFHWNNRYFPAFNIADAAITTGAIMMLIDAFWLQKRRQTASS